jgi:hypothetical protein
MRPREGEARKHLIAQGQRSLPAPVQTLPAFIRKRFSQHLETWSARIKRGCALVIQYV